MIIRKKILFIKSCLIILLLFNSCENPVENGAEIELPLQKPVITGLVITGEDSPDPYGYWRSPVTSNSIRYNVDNNGPYPIPRELRLDYPYPNPSSGSVITFSLPLKAQVSLWVVKGRLPEENEGSSVNISGGTFVSPNEDKVKVYLNKKNMAAGLYQYHVNDRYSNDELPDGFYRVYLKAEGYLFFRDILIARECGSIPADLNSTFHICRRG